MQTLTETHEELEQLAAERDALQTLLENYYEALQAQAITERLRSYREAV